MEDEVKKKGLELALAAANKQFGKNSVIVLGKTEIEPVPVIST